MMPLMPSPGSPKITSTPQSWIVSISTPAAVSAIRCSLNPSRVEGPWPPGAPSVAWGSVSASGPVGPVSVRVLTPLHPRRAALVAPGPERHRQLFVHRRLDPDPDRGMNQLAQRGRPILRQPLRLLDTGLIAHDRERALPGYTLLGDGTVYLTDRLSTRTAAVTTSAPGGRSSPG